MASDVNELTVNYEEDGQLVMKEEDKVILSRGSWTTIIYKFRQWDRKKNEFGAERYTIRRYRKVNDEYRQQSKFNVSSVDQAKKIVEALQKWIATSGGAQGDGGEDD
jgi:hypothetical protein